MSFCKAQTYAFACKYILIGTAPPLGFSTCRKSLRGNCLVYICRPPVHLHIKSSADARQYCASVLEQSMYYVCTYTRVMTFTIHIRQPSLRGETSPLLNGRPRNETSACRRPCRPKLAILDVSCIICKVPRYAIAQITNLVSSVS